MATYDEWARSTVEPGKPGGRAANENSGEQMTFRLEIVLVSGREGQKLQAIQARAIREALLWAAQREDNGTSPGEGESGGRDD
jgi:hypothetical protein